MIELASDDFNRADDPHIGADGSWTRVEGNAFPFKVASNTCVPVDTNFDETEYYSGISWPNDQYSQATLTGGSGSGGGEGPGVCLRASGTDPTDNLYRIAVSVGAGSSAIEVAKTISGAKTSIGSKFSTFSSGQVLKVEISGSSITTYKDGTAIDTRTDSAITSGSPGVFYSSTMASAVIDNWSGGGDAAAAVGVSNRYLVRHSRMTSW